jgi:hypothetical protein
MGPPAASLGKGKCSLGIDYAFVNTDLVRQADSDSSANRVVKIHMHKVYANLGYGLADNVDVFVRAGAGTLEWDDIAGRSYDWECDGGDWDFVWGGGMKATLSESPDVSWGFLAQFSDGTFTGSQNDGDYYDDHGTYQVTLHEMQIAAGPTWKAAQGLKIYGGPFVNLIRGRWVDEVWGDKNRKPVEQEGWLGGYLGAELNLAQNTNVTVEGQLTSDGYAIAAGLVFKQ